MISVDFDVNECTWLTLSRHVRQIDIEEFRFCVASMTYTVNPSVHKGTAQRMAYCTQNVTRGCTSRCSLRFQHVAWVYNGPTWRRKKNGNKKENEKRIKSHNVLKAPMRDSAPPERSHSSLRTGIKTENTTDNFKVPASRSCTTCMSRASSTSAHRKSIIDMYRNKTS